MFINTKKVPYKNRLLEMQVSSFRAKKKTLDTLKENQVNISMLISTYLDEIAAKLRKEAKAEKQE